MLYRFCSRLVLLVAPVLEGSRSWQPFLRMPEPRGEIIIEDLRTSTLNIRALRASVAVIPQRPFILTTL